MRQVAAAPHEALTAQEARMFLIDMFNKKTAMPSVSQYVYSCRWFGV